MPPRRVFRPVLVRPGARVRLRSIASSEDGGLDKEAGERQLAREVERIARLQDRLYAEKQQALILVLQGMDTSGKDGTIKDVFAETHPFGVDVTPFGPPTSEELAHDFLWRIHAKTPRLGSIAVWNRSHYEDVLVTRVRDLVPRSTWRARYEQINRFERTLVENDTRVLKVFLHISKAEQAERLRARLADPTKQWKFRVGDLDDRRRWDAYQDAYQDALTRCSTEAAPWWIVPADRKWYRSLVVARLVADTLAKMAPEYPEPELDPKKIRIR